jgi:hypothetical protein
MKKFIPVSLLALAACAAPRPVTYWRFSSAPPPSYWEMAGPPKGDGTPAEAARLIRESVPLYREVAEQWERATSKQELRTLLGKARRVERNLAQAQLIYEAAGDDRSDPGAAERRAKQLDELVAAIKTCIRQIESRL